MSSSKDKMKSPRKYVRRRGIARIDVIANKAVIEKWLDAQFNAEAIYRALIDNKLICETYSYRTFLRALYDLVPKSRANSSRPSKTRDAAPILEPIKPIEKVVPEKKEVKIQINPVVKSEMAKFAIPSNNITGDDD